MSKSHGGDMWAPLIQAVLLHNKLAGNMDDVSWWIVFSPVWGVGIAVLIALIAVAVVSLRGK